MKTLSIQQPWAWLIVNGHKDIENRSRGFTYRGPILIHAGKVRDRDFMPLGLPDICREIPRDLQYGGIVGIADIVDCVTHSSSPWFFGQNGLVLKNARPLPFFECRGRLGFFDIDYPKELLNA